MACNGCTNVVDCSAWCFCGYRYGALPNRYPVPTLMYEYDTVHQWETGECFKSSLSVWDGNISLVVCEWERNKT